VDLDQLRDLFERQIPFNAWLGLKVDHISGEPDGRICLRAPFRPELVGDFTRPALHGGLMSTLADASGGLALWAQLVDQNVRVSTIDLRVDYLRPGRLEDLLCDARVLRVGNRVGVTSMVLRQGDEVIADARGVYNVLRPHR
jgi:uncharacterized protein (TIGR00369 family)